MRRYILYGSMILSVLATVADAQYYPQPSLPPVVAPIVVNGVLTCPPGYRGPITTKPGGAEICVR